MSIMSDSNQDGGDNANEQTQSVSGIEKPLENDVIFGRGAGTNRHNKRFRDTVEGYKKQYVKCKRNEKADVAFSIIRKWRAQNPPGRFLKEDKATKTWYDVGDTEAKKKVIQALRENAPQIREEEGIDGTRPNEVQQPSPYGRVYSLNFPLDNKVDEINPLRETESRKAVSLPPTPVVRDTSMGTFIFDHNTGSAIEAVRPHQNLRVVSPEATSSWLGGAESPASLDFGPAQFRTSESTISSAGKRDSSRSEVVSYDEPSDSSRVKRSALNRDQSAATNRLKQIYCPEVFNVDLQSLSQNVEQIQLSGPATKANNTVSRPDGLNSGSRLTTRQAITTWAQGSVQTGSNNTPRTKTDQTVPRPDQFVSDSRVTTNQAITEWASVQQDGAFVTRNQLARQSTKDVIEQWAEDALGFEGGSERPAPLRVGDRMNTLDEFNWDIDDDES